MLTDDLEERIENLIRVKPATEPSLAGCLAVIDNLQEENDQLLVKCEMFEELVDNQNAEILAKNTKLVQVSEEKQFLKAQMKKLEQHLEDMFVKCETHKLSPLNKSQGPPSLTPPESFAVPEHQAGPNEPPEEAARGSIWRPFEDKPVEECIVSFSCEGNCQHTTCTETKRQTQSEPKVTCYNCKKEFPTKSEMMDHKRDSDHPSKKKCNQPECQKTKCWYVHSTSLSVNTEPVNQQEQSRFKCNTCQNDFIDKNELMHHR